MRAARSCAGHRQGTGTGTGTGTALIDTVLTKSTLVRFRFSSHCELGLLGRRTGRRDCRASGRPPAALADISSCPKAAAAAGRIEAASRAQHAPLSAVDYVLIMDASEHASARPHEQVASRVSYSWPRDQLQLTREATCL